MNYALGTWLGLFVAVSLVPIGALRLLLIRGITGGQWGEDLKPVLIPAARLLPALLLAFLPIVFLRPLIYDWHTLRLPRDVFSFYLNPAFFDARSLIGLSLWSALAWTGAWRREWSAAAGLVADIVIMTFLPADWILTLYPGSVSASFGFGFGIEQLLVTLALAAAIARQRDGRPTRDLSGMIVSAILGVVYFAYTQYLIIWYGNVPDRVHWFAARAGGSWPLVAFAAFALGAAIPFALILSPRFRHARTALRAVGILILSGAVLHIIWLIAPGIALQAVRHG